jgi:hypothetical protein
MMKNNLILLLTAGILATSCGGTQEEQIIDDSAFEVEESEWESLFDGESLEGWSKYGDREIGNAWKVQDGAIYLDATNKENWGENDGGDIVTEEEFADFHLKYEWKISKNGNSGLIFYVHESDEYFNTYNTGLEMQVLDNDGHPDAKITSHRAGDLYDLVESSEETVKPVGEWNQAEIISKDGNLEFYLNGVKTVSATLWNEEWDTMVANSKFKDMPGFAKYKKGKIALQDHGDEVWFRNIEIKRL